MKTRWLTPLLSFGLALSLGACRADAPAPGDALAASEPITLVTMGASDVAGVGADEPATQGWAPVLAERLTGRSDHVRLGEPGWTARQVRLNALDTAVKAQPDVVVLWVGVNDFKAGVNVEAFKQDLDPMLAALRGTGARVYVLNMPDLGRLPAFTAMGASIQAALPAWRGAIRDTADRHGATAIALTPYTDEILAHPEYLSADGFHPSTVGHRRLAGIVAQAMGHE
jgi:lysophospholipase L1-like esterase